MNKINLSGLYLTGYTSLKDRMGEFERMDEIVKFEPNQTIKFLNNLLMEIPLIVIASEIQRLSSVIKKINSMEDNNKRSKMFKPWIGKKLLKAFELRKKIEENKNTNNMMGMEFELEAKMFIDNEFNYRKHCYEISSFLNIIYDLNVGIKTKNYSYTKNKRIDKLTCFSRIPYKIIDNDFLFKYSLTENLSIENFKPINNLDTIDSTNKIYNDLSLERKIYISSVAWYSPDFGVLTLEEIETIANEFIRLGIEQKENEKIN